MSLSPIPTETRVVYPQTGTLTAPYQAWFQSIQKWLSPTGQFGATGVRPTKFLFVGQQYYDTTLGYPVWVHQVSPTIIWHNGAGSPV